MPKTSAITRIAVTDIETTGLDFKTHEIVEIGLLVVDQSSFEIVDSLDVKVRPEHIGTASESALTLNGYNEFDWKDSISLNDAMSLYSLKTANAIFCAHNVTFDWSFIMEAFRVTGVENKLDYHRLDLYTMAWLILRNSGLERFKLNKIASFLEIEEEPVPHRAIKGARTACEVLKRLLTFRCS